MARFSLYLVCGLVLGAVLVNAISQDPGYLLVTWGDWQLETSVWLALSALLLSLVLLWFILRALRTTLKVPRALRRWLGLRSARGAQRRADKGFAAFFEGHWDVAEKALKKGGAPDEQTLLHPLYAALAALHRGESARALALLEQADTEGSAPISLITLARAECHLKTGATDEVERALEQLSASERKTPRAKALRAEAAYLQRDSGKAGTRCCPKPTTRHLQQCQSGSAPLSRSKRQGNRCGQRCWIFCDGTLKRMRCRLKRMRCRRCSRNACNSIASRRRSRR